MATLLARLVMLIFLMELVGVVRLVSTRLGLVGLAISMYWLGGHIGEVRGDLGITGGDTISQVLGLYITALVSSSRQDIS